MKKRGKVLRGASDGAGLLIVDGQQYPFSIEGMWKSEVPPNSGTAVEVEFDQDGKIHAVHAISESQIAREQAENALAIAKQTGSALAAKAVAKFGLPTLVAAGLLMIAWLFLAAVSVQTPLGKLDFTFWQILGFLNSSNSFEAMMQGRGQPGAGFYGLLALISIAGPFVRYFWKDKRAAMAGLLPLLFMLIVGLMIRSTLENSFGSDVPAAFSVAMKQMRDEALAAVSLGFGTYLSGLVSLYFAAIALKEFLARKTTGKQNSQTAQRAAA
jgi:hypothetical protein